LLGKEALNAGASAFDVRTGCKAALSLRALLRGDPSALDCESKEGALAPMGAQMKRSIQSHPGLNSPSFVQHLYISNKHILTVMMFK
jgi:hypothetical protein